jgi:hypothetical protein
MSPVIIDSSAAVARFATFSMITAFITFGIIL